MGELDLERKAEDDFVEWVRDLPYPAIALKLILFGLKGWPDRTILAKGRIFFIEFKRTKKDKLRPSQIPWRKHLRRLGFKYYVCTSKEEAIEAYHEVIG